MRPLGVRSGFALCPVGVCSGSTLANPDRTPKANPGSGLGPLSVRLGPVGTVYRKSEMPSILYNGWTLIPPPPSLVMKKKPLTLPPPSLVVKKKPEFILYIGWTLTPPPPSLLVKETRIYFIYWLDLNTSSTKSSGETNPYLFNILTGPSHLLHQV